MEDIAAYLIRYLSFNFALVKIFRLDLCFRLSLVQYFWSNFYINYFYAQL